MAPPPAHLVAQREHEGHAAHTVPGDGMLADLGLTPLRAFVLLAVLNVFLLPVDVLRSRLAPAWSPRLSHGGTRLPPPATAPTKAPDSVGVAFVTYRTPRAFVDALTQYRAVYPEGDIVFMADSGGYDYSHAAAKVGATIVPATGPLSTKRRGSVYVTRYEAAYLASTMHRALQRIRDPWFILLENDVRVVRRVPLSSLNFSSNGGMPNQATTGRARLYLQDLQRPPGPYNVHVQATGLGGCILNTSFYRDEVFGSPRLEQVLDQLFQPVGEVELGMDMFYTALTWALGGTTGTWPGYYAMTEDNLQLVWDALEAGKVDVLHFDKYLYEEQPLRPHELEMLGPDFAGWPEVQPPLAPPVVPEPA